MNYPLFIARKLSLSENGEKRSVAINVAVTAVALSIAVMIISIGIVVGFKKEIIDKIIGFNSHLSLTINTDLSPDDNLVSLSPTLKNILDNEPYITSYSLETAIPAILKTPEDFKGVYLKGIDNGNGFKFIERNLVKGNMPKFDEKDNYNKIVISETASRQLGVSTGDKIYVYFLSDDIRVRNLQIAGVFNSHFDAYDDVFIYGSINLVNDLANLPDNKGTSIKIYTDDLNKIEDYTDILKHRLDKALIEGEIYRPYNIINAKSYGASYMHWLDLLDMNVLVIIILMTLVSVITLISGMLIIILDKIRFIGMMKALGASNSKLQKVFIYLALKITVTGALIGNIFALGFLYLQQKFHLIPLDADNYYIDFVPVCIDWISVIALNVCVIAVVYLSLILPSRLIAKISPVKSMKIE